MWAMPSHPTNIINTINHHGFLNQAAVVTATAAGVTIA
jgi:hypothetical protein